MLLKVVTITQTDKYPLSVTEHKDFTCHTQNSFQLLWLDLFM